MFSDNFNSFTHSNFVQRSHLSSCASEQWWTSPVVFIKLRSLCINHYHAQNPRHSMHLGPVNKSDLSDMCCSFGGETGHRLVPKCVNEGVLNDSIYVIEGEVAKCSSSDEITYNRYSFRLHFFLTAWGRRFGRRTR